MATFGKVETLHGYTLLAVSAETVSQTFILPMPYFYRFLRSSRCGRDRRGLGSDHPLPPARLLLLFLVKADEEEAERGRLVWHQWLRPEEKHRLF